MVTIYIDNAPYQVDEKKNLLDACLSIGLDIPYFCYHPALGSVGSCRLCAVKLFRDEKDAAGRTIMSCMEPVREGMRISINNNDLKEFRASITESLMTNHPHDCPICDEGGECHLQDMTVMTGHNYRRFDFKKKTYQNQYLGPFVNHEMNRCITCYRCVRFYRDYAGGKDLGQYSSHNTVYFGRHKSGVLESEFAGNLVEVCPTGVFTDKTLKKHFTRKWDLTNAPSVCTHCSLGCNTLVGERYGILRRVLNRYNGQVNGYFLCDRGRFGYEFVNAKGRIKQSLWQANGEGEQMPVKQNELIESLNRQISGTHIVGIGSPRASIEANYALQKLSGNQNFYAGVNDTEHNMALKIAQIMQKGNVHIPSLKELETYDAVIVLGEDVTNTAPRVALALRQAVRNQTMALADKQNIPHWHDIAVRTIVQDKKGPLFVAMPFATKVDDIATQTYNATPFNIAQLGFAVAANINNNAPKANNLSPEQLQLAANIAIALKNSNKPLIISGTQLLCPAIIDAAANIAYALKTEGKDVGLFYTLPQTNSLGLALLENKNIDNAFESKNNDTLIILENDLYRCSNKDLVDEFIAKFKQVIVIDHSETETSVKADYVLAAGTFAESEGTMVNNEGRAQRFYSVMQPSPEIKPSWLWLTSLIEATTNTKNSFNDLINQLSTEYPALSGVNKVSSDVRELPTDWKAPRQTLRFTGRTSMNANVNVHEQKPPVDENSSLAFSMEGYKGETPASAISFYWKPGWNSVQSANKYLNELNGALKGKDPGVRLFTDNDNNLPEYFKFVPENNANTTEFITVPYLHIYGSDETSAKGAAIIEQTPQPTLFINSKNLIQLGFTENSVVNIFDSEFIVKVNNSLALNVVALSKNLPNQRYIKLPNTIKFNK